MQGMPTCCSASPTTKTGRNDIAEILLKVALKHQKSIKINLSADFSILAVHHHIGGLEKFHRNIMKDKNTTLSE
jgi:hypothetical protein